MAKRVDPYLSSARAFWRLAAKARKAGNARLAEHYQSIGDQRYRQYERNRAPRPVR